MGRGMYPPQPTIYINNLNDKVKKEGQWKLLKHGIRAVGADIFVPKNSRELKTSIAPLHTRAFPSCGNHGEYISRNSEGAKLRA